VAQSPKRELGEPFEKVCAAVGSGHSVLVLGEVGIGGTELARALYEEMLGDFQCAIAIYKGSLKKFFQLVAFQLEIPTTETQYNKDGDPTGEKDLTVDALKEEIAANCSDGTLLIFPEAKRLTTSIRYWLEDLIANGVVVVCFAAANPGRDMLEIELDLPSDRAIREEMRAEAQRLGLQLEDSKLAELQSFAGRNPMLARKVVRNERLGLNRQNPQHTQYLDISPIIISSLMTLGIVRFIGMGTGNKGLYIVGGCALIAGMILKQIGQIRGARKRLGQ
jgi:hypothetical protein